MRRPFMRPVPMHYYENEGRLEWPPEVTADLEQLRAEMRTLAAKEERFLRAAARELGLSAEKLEDLRSDAGNTFAEIEYGHQRGRGRVRLAREQNGPQHREEWAYYCASPTSWREQPQVGCGWVKGIPEQRSYDSLGPLAGSAGTEDYCRICGALIGIDKQVVS